MWYVIFSIICSVSVGILLKIAKRFQVNIFQIITWNYATAFGLTYIFYKPQIKESIEKIPVELLLSLAILLPIVFLFQNASIKNSGIVKTDIAQRLSLFIPILASYFIFAETFNNYKIIGLVFGFSAIFFTLSKKSEHKNSEVNWIYPTLVLFGFGIIDTLFKRVASLNAVPFTTLLFFIFCGALLLSILIVLYKVIIQKETIKLENSYWGIGIGILNFGNILFYLNAHKALQNNPSTVFAGMNMGVIILGSIAGILIFKEKLSQLNYIGIFLAILSIICITLSLLE
jgi:drug/metabolite transporter (DMT)-like permease